MTKNGQKWQTCFTSSIACKLRPFDFDKNHVVSFARMSKNERNTGLYNDSTQLASPLDSYCDSHQSLEKQGLLQTLIGRYIKIFMQGYAVLPGFLCHPNNWLCIMFHNNLPQKSFLFIPKYTTVSCSSARGDPHNFSLNCA